MEPDLERLRRRIQELEVANEKLHQSEQSLTTQREILQRSATRLSSAQGTEALFEQILNTAWRGSEIVRQLMVYAGKESAVVGPLHFVTDY